MTMRWAKQSWGRWGTKESRLRKVYKGMRTEDETRELPLITRMVCVTCPARQTPRMMTRNLASMSSGKPRTAPATVSKKKDDRSSSPKTVVVPEVAAAEAIWRDEATKQASETMGKMIVERWANSEMQMVWKRSWRRMLRRMRR